MTGTNAPTLADKLKGCDVLPPLNDDRPRRLGPTAKAGKEPHIPCGEADKAKGKPGRRPTRDRFTALNTFVDFTAWKLKRSELLVWLTLYRDTRDGTAATAQADLARRTGVSLRSVGLAIGRLERRELLVVVQRGGLSRGPSRYRVQPLGKGD